MKCRAVRIPTPTAMTPETTLKPILARRVPRSRRRLMLLRLIAETHRPQAPEAGANPGDPLFYHLARTAASPVRVRRRALRPVFVGRLVVLPVVAGAELAEPAADVSERLRELARDDPHLVRLALRDLREHLQILVREELRVGISLVDRLEDRVDRLCLAFGFEHHRLPLPLRPQDRALLLALRRQHLRLLHALRVEDGGALVPVGA